METEEAQTPFDKLRVNGTERCLYPRSCWACRSM